MITVLEREVLFRRTVKVININPQAGLADDCMGSVRCDRKTEMYKVNEHISPIFCIPDTHSEHRFPAPSKDVVNQCLEFVPDPDPVPLSLVCYFFFFCVVRHLLPGRGVQFCITKQGEHCREFNPPSFTAKPYKRVKQINKQQSEQNRTAQNEINRQRK